MKNYLSRRKRVKAFVFDPQGEHKYELPDMVSGATNRGYGDDEEDDGWASRSCIFWVNHKNGIGEPIKQGDYLVLIDGEYFVYTKDRFEDLFEEE